MKIKGGNADRVKLIRLERKIRNPGSNYSVATPITLAQTLLRKVLTLVFSAT